ncbi:MAG: NAD(P)-dependent oxidoreductase [Vannielia sp.]|uniref:NAD(P)-dependent oxidoreductase n=1 Tax=Vannielia sp. TaxID=2813045 RepID=UPI003B8CD409
MAHDPTTSAKPSVGVIGAGMMGGGMAASLLRAGHRVTVLPHRNRSIIDRLIAAGAEESASAAELAGSVDVVLTCLPDGPAVEARAAEILPALSPGALWIDTTTSDPEVTRRIAAQLAERGATLADAPVTGSPAQAEAGDLASMVGCDEDAFERVESVVSVYSRVVRRFGNTGTGHTAKLMNNLVTQGTMALLTEAYGAAHRLGVDWRALYDVMCVGAARSGTLEKAVGPALSGNFDGARFTIRNAEKDLRYAAATLGPQAELARAAHAVLLRQVEAGRGDQFVSQMLQPTEKDGR